MGEGKALAEICATMLEEYEVEREQLEADVLSLATELADRRAGYPCLIFRLVILADGEQFFVVLDNFDCVYAAENPLQVKSAGLEAALSARENVAICN